MKSHIVNKNSHQLQDKQKLMKKLLRSKDWRELYTKNELSVDKENVIKKMLNTLTQLTIPNIRQIASLCNNIDDIQQIFNYFLQYNKLTPNEKRARTEHNFILFYGDVVGKELWKQYNNKLSKMTSESGYIERFGENDGKHRWIEYKKRLSESGIKRVAREGKILQRERSQFCIEYWLKKGVSYDDAKEKIHEIQKANNVRAVKTKKLNPIKINPYDVGHWVSKGYCDEDAKIKVEQLLFKTNVSLPSMIARHGEEIGTKIYNESKIKRQETYIKKLKNGDYDGLYKNASKESLKYFIPLYKLLRTQHGIERDDIYFGISGSKEFYLASGTKYYFLYDFTIRSKKIIIEYNNVRWHPHPDMFSEDEWRDWRLFNLTAQEKYDNDSFKIDIAKKLGYKCLIIWNLDSYDDNMKKILEFIGENIDGH